MLFNEAIHMHVGYYENNHDLEGIFLKILNDDVWCLFYNDEKYELKVSKKASYPFLKDFGYLVKVYSVSEREFTEERANALFKRFLCELV
ncbi:DUF3986 family protein [Alkalicoccobacillus gibsonii]|uniref:DUF3986 family protein n=1 Tax=Alkalicoccobacillus gibsonii TaxID=79881 RepID=A0ABU9VCZ7_9BACI